MSILPIEILKLSHPFFYKCLDYFISFTIEVRKKAYKVIFTSLTSHSVKLKFALNHIWFSAVPQKIS